MTDQKSSKNSASRRLPLAQVGRRIRGASLTEYAMVAGLIAVGSIGAVAGTGVEVEKVFCRATSSIAQALGHDYDGDCLDEPAGIPGAGDTEDDPDADPDTDVGVTPDPDDEDDPAPTPPNHPEGISPEGEFIDIVFPMYSKGLQQVLMPTSTYPVEVDWDHLHNGSNADDLHSCADTSGEVLCEPLNVPLDEVSTRNFGYQVTLPEEVRAEWSRIIRLTVFNDDKDPAKVWIINASREQAPVIHEPNLTFSDKNYPAGTTDAQQVLVPLVGEFNGDLTFSVGTDVTARKSACVQLEEGGVVNCSYPSNGTATIDVPQDAYAIGYEIDVSGDRGTKLLELAMDAKLASKFDPETQESYAWLVSREARRAQMDLDFDFEDISIPAETEMTWDFTRPLVGDVDLPLTFSVSSDVEDVRLCKKLSTVSYVQCTSVGSTSVSIQLEENTTDLGFRFNTGNDNRKEFDTNLHIVLANVDQPDVSEDWDINVFKQAMPIVLEPQFDISDYTYDVGEVRSSEHLIAFEGDFNGEMLFSATPTNGTRVQVCWKIGNMKTCGSAGDTSSVTVPENADEIGYAFLLPVDDREEWSEQVDFELSSKLDPSVKKTWSDVTISREAREIVFEPQFTQPNMQAAGDKSGYATFMWDAPGTYTGDMWWEATKISADPDIEYYIATCYEREGLVGTQCTGNSRSGSSIKVPEDITRLGFRIHFPATGTSQVRVVEGSLYTTIDGENHIQTQRSTFSRPAS